jgi:hypothetical protein
MTLSKKCTAYLLILLPVVTFFALFFRYTVNAPVNDDYPAVLQFLNRYVSTGSRWEKLRLIFSQHNEHRIVFSRLWSLISYKVNKHVNFNFLSFVGDLSLVGIALIFFRKFLLLKKSLFLFIPVTVFIFNITSWENMTFPMCALSNFVVHLFILSSLVFLTRPTTPGSRNTLLAILFFFIAFMTQGAALALFPVSLVILLLKKEYRHFLLYAALGLVVLLFYFHGYHRPPNSGDLMTDLLSYKVRTILFVFAFLGNAFNYFLIFTNEVQESIGITSIIGFSFFLLFLYITKKKYYRRNLFNYSIMVTVILTSVLAAVSRSSMGLEMAGASRYRINGIIFFISLYFWFIETYSVESKKALAAILLFSGWYFLMINLNQYEYLSVREEELNLEILCANAGEKSIVHPDSQDLEQQKKILRESSQLDVYQLPTDASIAYYLPYSKKEVENTGAGSVGVENDAGAANSNLEMTKSIHSIHKIGNDYLVSGFAFLEGKSTNHQQVWVGLKNQADRSPVFFTSKAIPRYDLNPYFHRYNPERSLWSLLTAVNLKNGGFRARIDASEITAGENTVWIKVRVDGQIKIVETDSKLIK